MDKELLDKYRHFNVEHGDWWDCVYETFKERMAEVGIEVERMYFSGFWSQGDGACFDGRIDNIDLYMDKHHPKAADYPCVKKLLHAGGSVVFKVYQRGHYCHENSITVGFNADEFWQVMPTPTEFHEQIVQALDSKLADELQEFERDTTVQFQGYMRALYRDLEAEYDHLTSDEAVWEAIEANELSTIEEGV
jgi:hypothetical protein